MTDRHLVRGMFELGDEWVGGPRAYRHAKLDVRLELDPVAPSAETRIEVLSTAMTRSAAGWPVELVEQRVFSATDTVEHQLLARYRMFDARPVLLIAGPTEQITAVRTELELIALSARSQPPGGAVCVAHLFAGIDD